MSQDTIAYRFGLDAIDHDPLGTTMPFQRTAQEPLGSRQIASLAEPELDRVAVTVNPRVQIHPPPADPDIESYGLLALELIVPGGILLALFEEEPC